MMAHGRSFTADLITAHATFPGLAAGDDAVGEKMRIQSITLNRCEGYNNWENNFYPTTDGNIISCKNYIHVKLFFHFYFKII
jgi:hypothetical protein